MVGLAILFIMALYVIVSVILLVKIPKKAKSRKGRIALFLATLVLVLAFPVGDPLISYLAFKNYCNEHSAPVIHRTADSVDRVALDISASRLSVIVEETKSGGYFAGPLKFRLEKYAYVEEIRDGKVFEYKMPQRISIHEVSIPSQLANFTVSGSQVAYNRMYRASEYKITDQSGFVMASMQVVTWHGGGFDGPLFNFTTGSYGTGKKIFPDTREVVRFIYSVLHPK